MSALRNVDDGYYSPNIPNTMNKLTLSGEIFTFPPTGEFVSDDGETLCKGDIQVTTEGYISVDGEELGQLRTIISTADLRMHIVHKSAFYATLLA